MEPLEIPTNNFERRTTKLKSNLLFSYSYIYTQYTTTTCCVQGCREPANSPSFKGRRRRPFASCVHLALYLSQTHRFLAVFCLRPPPLQKPHFCVCTPLAVCAVRTYNMYRPPCLSFSVAKQACSVLYTQRFT